MTRRSIFLLTTLLLVACGSGGGFNLISLEEEWQLGQQLSRDIERQVQLNRDTQVNAYVERLGRKIVAQTPMANMPWTFHVVEDPALNAFAIPGGHVYVNTGLIRAAGTASELAGVMGHEISHDVARHATQQISKQYGLSILASLVLGNQPGPYKELLAQLIGTGALARFSRDAEREADELGMKFMYAAGYDPRGTASMFRKLLEQSKRQPSSVEQFFSTHPLTENRIRDAESRASQLAPRSGMITDEPEFQAIRRRL